MSDEEILNLARQVLLPYCWKRHDAECPNASFFETAARYLNTDWRVMWAAWQRQHREETR